MYKVQHKQVNQVFTEGDSRVPMNDEVPATFDDGSTTKTVEGVGTYTVARRNSDICTRKIIRRNCTSSDSGS